MSVFYLGGHFLSDAIFEYFDVFWKDFNGKIYDIPVIRALYSLYSNTRECYEWGVVYIPINNLTMIFQSIIENRGEHFVRSVENIISQSYMFFVWAVIGITCTLGYFKTFIRKSAEKAGDISDSLIGYKFLVPFYGYILLAMGISELLCVFILAMMVTGYAFYRRGVKFRKSDIICLLIGLIVPLIGVFFSAILFFGSPIFAGAGMGASICALLKIIENKTETEEKEFKRKLRKYIIGIVIFSLIFILSVAAIIVSTVFAILS
jgi:ABC-type glycerol-3-phosphate transport system permease component